MYTLEFFRFDPEITIINENYQGLELIQITTGKIVSSPSRLPESDMHIECCHYLWAKQKAQHDSSPVPAILFSIGSFWCEKDRESQFDIKGSMSRKKIDLERTKEQDLDEEYRKSVKKESKGKCPPKLLKLYTPRHESVVQIKLACIVV